MKFEDLDLSGLDAPQDRRAHVVPISHQIPPIYLEVTD